MGIEGRTGLTIQGIDGPVNVPAGEFITNPKARIRRMMKNHLSRNARMVYACLDLATMGWQQELAVTRDKRGVRPLTSGDISSQTELDEADVRRALDELDGAGLGERRATDAGKLRKGKVEIYSWAFPREPKKVDPRCAHPENIGWIPDSARESLKPLTAYAKRCRYRIPATLPDDARTRILEQAEEIARNLENAEKEAARFWDSVCAPAAYKEERTDITSKEQEQEGRQVEEEDAGSLPACPTLVSEISENGNATPHVTTAEQILSLPAVQELEEQLQDSIGPALASLIAINLRDAPPEALEHRIRLKAKDARSLAILPSYAADVAKANDARKTRQENAAKANAEQSQRQTTAFINEHKRDWARLSESDRKTVREIYPEEDWPPG